MEFKMIKWNIKRRVLLCLLFVVIIFASVVFLIYFKVQKINYKNFLCEYEKELKFHIVCEYQNSDNVYLVRHISSKLGSYNGKIKPELLACSYEVLYCIKGDALNPGECLELSFKSDPVFNEHYVLLLNNSFRFGDGNVYFLFCSNQNLKNFCEKDGIKTYQLGIWDGERLISFDDMRGKIFWKYLDEIGWRKQPSVYYDWSKNLEI